MKILKKAINNSVKGGNLTLKIFFFSSDIILKLDFSFDIFTHAIAGLWIKYSFHIPILVRQKKKKKKSSQFEPVTFLFLF